MRKTLVLLCAIGCGGGNKTPDAAIDAPLPPDAAPPADAPPRGDATPAADANNLDASNDPSFGALMPVLVKGPGSPLGAPVVIPISWDNDKFRTYAEEFFREYGASDAWSAQVSEYGVGAMTEGMPEHIAGKAPASLGGGSIESILKTNLGASGPWGAPNPNAVYAFLIPLGTTVTDAGLCCTDFDGYHSDTMVGAVDVAYSVQCQCPGFDGPNVDDLQQLTIVASHETVEAVTDPFVSKNPAYAQTDDAHAVWTIVTGGEAGDLCLFADNSFYTPANMIDAAQRTWSNAEAALGHDPCVSEGMAPYYQTIPDDPDALSITYFGPWATRGTKVAVGANGTITLHVYANPDSGPYVVSLDDYSSTWFGGAPLLTFTEPTGVWANGATITVPVTVNAADSSLATGEIYIVNTRPAAGGPTTYYYALVGQ
jgi:hypothetical protein